MTTKEVFEKVCKDNELIMKVKAMGTREEVYEVYKGLGLTDSIEEFKRVVDEMNASFGKFSKEELDGVVGGADTASMNLDSLGITPQAASSI